MCVCVRACVSECFKQDIFCKCLWPSSPTSRTVSLTNGDSLWVTAGYFAAIILPQIENIYASSSFCLSALCCLAEKFFSRVTVQFQPSLLNVIIFAKIAKAQHVFSGDLIVLHRGQIMKGLLCYSSWALIVLKATIVPGALQAPGDISCSDWSLDEVSHNHRHHHHHHTDSHWLQSLYSSPMLVLKHTKHHKWSQTATILATVNWDTLSIWSIWWNSRPQLPKHTFCENYLHHIVYLFIYLFLLDSIFCPSTFTKDPNTSVDFEYYFKLQILPTQSAPMNLSGSHRRVIIYRPLDGSMRKATTNCH